MAYESVAVTPGTGKDVAVDTVDGKEIQIVKLDVGADGVSDPVVGALPVDVTGQGDVPITLDGEQVTVNLGATDNAILDTIATNTGESLTDTELRATPVPVSGTVTANLGATDNAVLDTIATNTGAALTDTELRATDVKVSLDSEVVAVSNAGLTELAAAIDTEVQVDVVGSLPAGTNNIGDVDVLSIAAGDNNIGNVDIASITAGETHIGEVGLADTAITISATVDTGAYADGDVLFATQEIASAVRVNGGSCILQSVHVIDTDDQGVDFDLVFFNANTSLGTENAAPDIDDTEVLTTLGVYQFTNDYVDLGANQVRTDTGIGLELKAGAATTSLYVAGITRGAPTYASGVITIVFGFLRN